MEPVPGVPSADGITFAILATTAGAGIAAGIVFSIVQLLKGAFPAFVERLSGAGVAFMLSAILYAITAVVLQPGTADGYLVIFVSWLNCALVAVGLHSTFTTGAIRAGVRALNDPGVASKAIAALPQEVLAPGESVVIGETTATITVPDKPATF